MRVLMALWFVLAASCSWAGMLQYVLAATTPSVPKPFTITFAGTPPANIVLHAAYAGPKTASLALYDSGDGVWHEYSSKTIPVSGGYVAFKGDWRTSAGTYNSMFHNALADTQYTCTFSGSFTEYPTHASAYRRMFYGCTRVTAIVDNPIPLLSGLPATDMFKETYYNMSGVTSLPEGFMDTSGLTGAPAGSMFYYACSGMSSVTALPEGFMNTSGLTGAPVAGMFTRACTGMSSVTNAYVFTFSSNITFTAANVNTVTRGWNNMSNWKGQVLWGTNVLALAIPIPDVANSAFAGCVNMPNYEVIHANWK